MSYSTVQLGELIAAVFDEAANYSTDPQEVSRLATQTVMHILRKKTCRLLPIIPPTPHRLDFERPAD